MATYAHHLGTYPLCYGDGIRQGRATCVSSAATVKFFHVTTTDAALAERSEAKEKTSVSTDRKGKTEGFSRKRTYVIWQNIVISR